ncbi:PucC family protein, partial [Granulosicoccus sp.]|nr:PucC family protein [Granulosicoccus sp.]
AAVGVLIGIVAFSMVIFADPLQSAALFRLGTLLIGFGSGLFAVSTLIMAMTMVEEEHTGLSLGAWGAAQATAAGVGIAVGGLLRDAMTTVALSGALGDALNSPAVGYSVVYHLEIALLFVALAALGPLTSVVNHSSSTSQSQSRQFGLAEFPN